MRKKILLIFISLIMMVPIFSTGSKELVIGCSVYKYEDPFISGTRAVISETAKNKASVIFADGLNSQTVQNNSIDNFFNQKVSALIINPVDRASAGSIIRKAKELNIPTVFFNREPFVEDLKIWNDKTYYVGSIAKDSGLMQAKIIADYWLSHPEADINGDGLLQYVIFRGEAGNQDTELRSEYCLQGLTKRGIKCDKVASSTSYWNRAKAQNAMTSILISKGSSIEVVIANNDEMALGAIDALKVNGYFTNDKFMPVVGVDATASALQAIENGTLLGTVLNDSHNQGRAIFNLAYELAKGNIPTSKSIGYTISEGRYVWIPYKIVDKSNFREYIDKTETIGL
ncbi:MAG: galactose ABC transporter substrate-binding protein [Spirochaetaceae bacterium]|nr:galactose ABC transporter substrate-binding protein [Spirochaetaceae bacterium]